MTAAPLVGLFLQTKATEALGLAPIAALGIWLAAARGIALGEGRTGRVAASMAVGAVVRVPLGMVLAAQFGINGAVLATGLGELVAAVVMGLPKRSTSPALQVGVRAMAGSFAVSAGLWLFTGVDALLARHFLDTTSSTSYLAAGTIARALLALPVAIVMGSLAGFAGADARGAAARLAKVGVVIGGFAVSAALALTVAGSLVQDLLFGSQLASSGLLIGLTVIAGSSGMVTATTYFLHARNHRGAHLIWVAAVTETVVIAAWHPTTTGVALGSASSLVVALGMLGLAVRNSVQPPAPEVSPAPELPLDDTLWASADPTIELSVVVPFYNPGESVGRTVRQIVDLLRATGTGFEVIPVSDGATDGSEAHVLAVNAPEVRLIVLPQNHGKGGALTRGMSAARGRYVAFIDADGDIDPVHLLGYLTEIRKGHEMVYASKRHADSVSFSSPLRKVVSLGFSTMTTVLFRLGVNDTQTGCKVMTRKMAAQVLPHMRERRFAFDLELFVLARRFGFRNLMPAPVELGERLAGSTVTSKAILRTLRDMLTIWRRATLQRAYPTVVAAPLAFPTRTPDLAPVQLAA